MRTALLLVWTTVVVGLFVVACASATSPTQVTTAPSVASPNATSVPIVTPIPTSPPQAVSPTPGRIAAGYTHTCALTSGGGVKCWGSNQNGQLGNGTTTDATVRGTVDVSGLASGVSAIAAGGSHTCALTNGGGVKCWGYNLYGQLGDGSNADRYTPVDVEGLTSGVTAITVGWSSTCALTSGGGVRCWGNNHFGWLGDGTTTDRSVPVEVAGLASGVTAIAAGTLHTCAVTNGGGVTCWGYGQSDDPTLFQSYVPVDVPGLASGVAAIAAALDRTCALMSDGGVTCWGPNYAPPPGESLPDRFVPVDVSGLASGAAAIALGESNLCALTNGGGVACSGDSNTPVEVARLGSDVVAIAVGGQHTCAMTDDGAVKCWGSNVYGQLGNVTRCSSSSVPINVPLDADVPTPPAIDDSYVLPIGRIEHATGPTDVVLRFDRGPDVDVGDLAGELFQPGPEFTLYGDGTVIFRNELAQLPPAEGSIIRARPFLIAQLDEDQVQALLRFALGEGGLGAACERYDTTQESDSVTTDVFTVRVGGLDKRVENVPLGALDDYLRNFGRDGIPTRVWVPDRYRGNLLDASIFQYIGDGLTPGLAETGTVAWPWSGVAPAEFAGLADLTSGRRVMSADEAAVLGLSDNGGVVQRIYLLGPDGETIYYFSLWPMLPDEGTGS